jgi:hypothetical protein
MDPVGLSWAAAGREKAKRAMARANRAWVFRVNEASLVSFSTGLSYYLRAGRTKQ